jgi:hypothetical protein
MFLNKFSQNSYVIEVGEVRVRFSKRLSFIVIINLSFYSRCFFFDLGILYVIDNRQKAINDICE